VCFKRPQPRKYGVGNYLFLTSILNQVALFFLSSKFAHVLLGSFGLITSSSCKSVSYLLSVFTRSTSWLTTWITVERLLLILFPTSTSLKNPQIAICLSSITLFLLFVLHTHEVLVYTTIHQQPDSRALVCVSNFDNSALAAYNRISTLFHTLVPFFVQTVSITLLIIFAARSRAKTAGSGRTFMQVLKIQMRHQKELYITPAIIVLSSVPQAILSFTLACTQLRDWHRHFLLTAILLSYAPQMLGIVLYVLPSSNYRKEFGQTWLGKKLNEVSVKWGISRTSME
jgi:hypothetical protein